MQRRSLLKFTAYAFLSLVALLVCIIALAFSPMGVSLLVNIANDQAEISIEEHSGSFYSNVDFTRITFTNPQVHADLTNVSLDISINCLFLGQACLQNLSLDQALVSIKPSEDETVSEPLSEYITLPLALIVEQIKIKQFVLYTQSEKDKGKDALGHKTLEVSDFLLALSAHENININTLSIKQLTMFEGPEPARQQVKEKANNTPILSAIAAYEYSPISIPNVFVPVNLSAPKISINQICMQSNQAVCTHNTQVQLSLLQQKLKSTISTQPQEQILSALEVFIDVDLAKQFTHKITTSLHPNKSLTSEQAQTLNVNMVGNIQQTKLVVSEKSKSGARVLLEMTTAQDISSEKLPLNLQIQTTGMFNVLPLWLASAELPLNNFTLSIEGDTQQYELVSSLELQGQQASKIDIDAQLLLQDKALLVKRVQSQGEIGDLLASVNIALKQGELSSAQAANKLSVNANLAFTGLKLQTLVPKLDSNLSGKFDVKGEYLSAKNAATNEGLMNTDSEISGSLLCDNISGSLQGYDLSFVCNALIDKSGLISVKSFKLLQGNIKSKHNEISGKGNIALPQGLNVNVLTNQLESADKNIDLAKAKSDFSMRVLLQELTHVHPKLTGSVEGNVNIKGSLEQPDFSAKLNIDAIKFNEIRVQNAILDLSTDAAKNWRTQLTLVAENLLINNKVADRINVSLSGDMKDHKLSVALSHPDYSLQHELKGELLISETLAVSDESLTDSIPQAPWKWQGQWLQGEWVLPFVKLELDQAIDIHLAENSAVISAHCWQASGTEKQGLCVNKVSYENEELNAKAQLSYDISEPLLFYFADIVMPSSRIPLNADISIEYAPKSGLRADAYTLITDALLVTSRHKINLMAIVANVELDNENIHTNIYAGTKTFGSFGLRSEVLLEPDNRQHKGQLQINDVQLSPLLRFLPTVEKIVGKIAGNLNFSGPLNLPIVNGVLNVNDGELVLDSYPYPVTNFNQSVQVVNNHAKVEGEFELGSGTGEYNADISLENGFTIVGNIKGAGMQLAYGEHELIATPDLSFDVKPENIKLTGQITVPNALFVLKSLPESARSPSSDTLIIGEELEPPIVPIGLDVNIRLLIDKPKLKRVKIDALDLKASLAGDLRLRVRQQKNATTGEFSPLETNLNGSINILEGSYEAYGQMMQIRNGDIYFSGPPSLPQFDIAAIRNPLNTADQVIAGVRISGNPVVPKVELFSEPAMIQARQLSYLLQGTDLGGGEGTSTDVMLVNHLVNFGIGSSENRVNKLGKSLGFDSLNIQTAGQGTNTQVQVTGRISENIQVTYGVGLFDSVSEVVLKYQLLPKLYLEAKSGANSALDLFYEVARGE